MKQKIKTYMLLTFFINIVIVTVLLFNLYSLNNTNKTIKGLETYIQLLENELKDTIFRYEMEKRRKQWKK